MGGVRLMLSLNTLHLCRQLLGAQTISANAPRVEIEAVLAARDELDAAIAEASETQAGDS